MKKRVGNKKKKLQNNQKIFKKWQVLKLKRYKKYMQKQLQTVNAKQKN